MNFLTGKRAGNIVGAALSALALAVVVFTAQQRAAASAYQPSTAEKVFLPYLARAYPPPSPPAADDWLAHLNYYRALAYLPKVAENSDWSNGNWLHSRYTVKNDLLQHSENQGNPWYTPEGNAAAQSSNLFGSFNTLENDSTAISWWVSGPFHAVGLLTPQLLETGYGSYREGDGGLMMAAGIDIIRGVGGVPPSVGFPVRWPGEGTIVHLTHYAGEIPDPLTSCPGYTHPAGLPIILQLGTGALTPQVTSTSLLENGVPVEHCAFDETNYNNPNAGYQNLGRGLLDGRDAVVIVPRLPFAPGSQYTVSVSAGGSTHTWSFKVAEGAAKIPGDFVNSSQE